MSKSISLAGSVNGMFVEIPLGNAAAPSSAQGRRPVRAGISLLKAGDMSPWRADSVPRRQALLHGIGWPDWGVYAVHQAHTLKVERVSGRAPSELASLTADGLICEYGERLLTVTVADCLSIFIVDPLSGAFGIVHSGWKGTGIVREAIRRMRVELGVGPERLAVSIGPGIGPCCYGVSRERFEEFRSRFGETAVSREGGDEHRLDLRRANVALLEEAGVTDITVISDCTSCGRGFGSFRREGPAAFTRMMAFIGPFGG